GMKPTERPRSLSDHGTGFAWGVGAQAHFLSRFAVRLEYEHFNVREADDAQLYTLGRSYAFL
ncbi:MAG: outer membrane beta-barrel protein, partial [Steroidobacteraceae bacterium]